MVIASLDVFLNLLLDQKIINRDVRVRLSSSKKFSRTLIELELVGTRLNYQFTLRLWEHLQFFAGPEVFHFEITRLDETLVGKYELMVSKVFSGILKNTSQL